MATGRQLETILQEHCGYRGLSPTRLAHNLIRRPIRAPLRTHLLRRSSRMSHCGRASGSRWRESRPRSHQRRLSFCRPAPASGMYGCGVGPRPRCERLSKVSRQTERACPKRLCGASQSGCRTCRHRSSSSPSWRAKEKSTEYRFQAGEIPDRNR